MTFPGEAECSFKNKGYVGYGFKSKNILILDSMAIRSIYHFRNPHRSLDGPFSVLEKNVTAIKQKINKHTQ